MKKGEIWLVELPSADGREQIGTRPALVLKETGVNIEKFKYYLVYTK